MDWKCLKYTMFVNSRNHHSVSVNNIYFVPVFTGAHILRQKAGEKPGTV
jgi:hypothetical protein